MSKNEITNVMYLHSAWKLENDIISGTIIIIGANVHF